VKGQGKLNMRIIFKSVDAAYRKLSKLVYACRNYSFPKLALFWDTV